MSVPRLRFPEFSEVWEEQRLADICKINPNSGRLPEKFIYIDLESVENGVLLKENYINLSDAPSRAQRLLNKDDILFQTVRPYQKNNFYFDKIDIRFQYVASTGYAQLRTYEDSKFLYQYLHTQKFVDSILEKCTGTSYPAINSSDLSKIIIYKPSLEEQQKIGDFFMLLDKRIEQQEQKIALLKDYKKAMMQKIFSQKIRFKDENGNDYPDWKEKMLGGIANIQTGNMNVEDNMMDGEYYFFDRSITIKKLNSYTFDNEAIIYPGEGSEFLPRYFKGKYALHQRSYSINSIVGNNIKYIYHFLQTKNNYFLTTAVGSTVKSLRKNCFENCNISLPYLLEQEKIESILSSIIFKVEQQEKLLKNLKRYKKSMIHKMFV